MVERFDPPRDLDWKPLPMRPDIAGQYVRYSDLAAARAEIGRLKQGAIELATMLNEAADAQIRAAEAERDLARAWVAKAFKMAMNETAKGPGFIDRIRELTPADAQAALEAYGREKVREGMQRAADLCKPAKAKMDWGNKWEPARKNPQSAAAQGARKQCYNAILAAMEKEGGE